MMSPMFTIQIQPSNELMLAIDAIVTVGNRLAAAIEAQNKIEYQRGDGPTEPAVMPVPEVKATPAVLAVEPVKVPANAAAVIDTNASMAGRPSVPGRFPASPRGDNRLITEERAAVIRREWPKGTHVQAILSVVNAMPGRPMTATYLGILANKLGMRRPVKAPHPQIQTAGPVAADQHAAANTRAPGTGEGTHRAPVPPESRIDIMRRLATVQPARPPQPPAVAAPIPRGSMPSEMRMDAMSVLRWAGQRGIALHLPISEDDMDRVNRKAKEIGHPPIVYSPPQRPGHQA